METQVEVNFSNGSGTFFIEIDNNIAAEMTFVIEANIRLIIKHTVISPAHRGKGLGKMLVAKAVEFARNNGMKITPQCEYAKSIFDKTPSFKDVL